MQLVEGNVYKRSDLHDALGGNRQAGISPCKKASIIMIFSNKRGESHGYEDGWDSFGYFRYTGAGQKGDQDLEHSLHNGRLLHHKQKGNSVHLFTEADKRSHYVYEGELSCVDYEYIQTKDNDGKNRKAVQFILEKVIDPVSVKTSVEKSAINRTKKEYRPPDVTSRRGLVTSRVGQGYYRRSLIEKFDGVCAVRGTGPEEILIASHIVPWRDSTDLERLNPDNGILLLPHYDALFDKHFISFEDSGEIIISNRLNLAERNACNLSGNERIEVAEGMKPYLARHRDCLR